MPSSSAQAFRLSHGGLIDRARRLRFRFDGRDYEGHPGDTLASALLANGVHLVGRSFKYHRPRGIVSAGAEEPNALVQVGNDPRTDPNWRATQTTLYDGLTAEPQNCWPSLRADVGAANGLLSGLFPAGFYYKTFMWPASLWMRYEEVIRRAAGLGRAPRLPDPDHYDKTYAHCDVLVIGAGPAGLAAALTASATGARVILVEQDDMAGGDLLATAAEETIDGKAPLAWLAEATTALEDRPNVRILTSTQCFAWYDHNFLGLIERLTDHQSPGERRPGHPRQRLWKVRAKQVVLASGAIERPLVFRDNDRPGVMLAHAAEVYLRRYAVKPGGRAVVCTNNDSGYGAALALHEAGVTVAAVADLREEPSGPLTDKARAAGLPVRAGTAVIATKGRLRVSGALLAALSADGRTLRGSPESVDCDLLLSSGGWTPSVHLHSQAKGPIVWDEALSCFRPDARMPKGRFVAGAANGTFGLGACLAEGQAVGARAAAAAGFAVAEAAAPQADDRGFLPIRPLFLVPADKPLGRGGKHFVDQQNDVTAADLKLAVREGYRSVEHVKRYTTTGMGTDQGKTGNVNALGIVAETLGRPLPEIGVTTFRPPYTPVTFGIFAGRDVDDLLDPVRTTPMHAWHSAHGALFEDVGQWKRAWYYPRAGEDLHAAVNREVKAVRDSVGILDASTLGKIDIQGRDAATFLNRIYTNAWSKLEVGRCRYGLMLKEDGMVMDDGVTARLGEHRFLMHTTTGNAAPVLAHLEEWLQTEWPDLEVFLTSVTEQFATVTLSGPNARHVLAAMTDMNLSSNALPHMGVAEGIVAGVRARVFRISFTGELSFEVNVPASAGLAVWEAAMRAGARWGITPYGTEAMHVLRAEKGFIIVGQETDGSVTPLDLGMDWAVSKQKDFIGKRSLTRSDMGKADRKQLVGLLTEDPREVLPEGAQLVEQRGGTPPLPMIGHVTSSYWSPNVGHSIALALVKGGRARLGQTVYAPLARRTVACRVVEPVFFDKEGERLRA